MPGGRHPSLCGGCRIELLYRAGNFRPPGYRIKNELTANTKGMDVEIVHADIRTVGMFAGFGPELIVCCGDVHQPGTQEEPKIIAFLTRERFGDITPVVTVQYQRATLEWFL